MPPPAGEVHRQRTTQGKYRAKPRRAHHLSSLSTIVKRNRRLFLVARKTHACASISKQSVSTPQACNSSTSRAAFQRGYALVPRFCQNFSYKSNFQACSEAKIGLLETSAASIRREKPEQLIWVCLGAGGVGGRKVSKAPHCVSPPVRVVVLEKADILRRSMLIEKAELRDCLGDLSSGRPSTRQCLRRRGGSPIYLLKPRGLGGSGEISRCKHPEGLQSTACQHPSFKKAIFCSATHLNELKQALPPSAVESPIDNSLELEG